MTPNRTILVGQDKFIHVYDNVFGVHEQEYFEHFFRESFFKYNNQKATDMTAHLPSSFLHSRYNQDDVERLCILKPTQKILTNYENLSFAASWVNLSLPGAYYQKHTDAHNSFDERLLTFMYYGTTTWQESYGGETFFYNDAGEKEIVVDYKPGRLVIFDSRIPHKPAFSYGHVAPRYTFVILFTQGHEQVPNQV